MFLKHIITEIDDKKLCRCQYNGAFKCTFQLIYKLILKVYLFVFLQMPKYLRNIIHFFPI
jgi:hypothetical protein